MEKHKAILSSSLLHDLYVIRLQRLAYFLPVYSEIGVGDDEWQKK